MKRYIRLKNDQPPVGADLSANSRSFHDISTLLLHCIIGPQYINISQFTQEDVMAFEVFISYSHQDQALCTELDKHLSNLKRQNIITSWYDGDITPGTEW